MEEPEKPKSLPAQTLILVILLADVGLVILGWYYYQRRQARYNAAGLDLSSAPPPDASKAAPAPSRPTAMPPLPVIPEPTSGPGRKARATASAAARAGASAPDREGYGPRGADRETAELMRRSAHRYFAIKNNPRFRDSPAIKEWRREFLSYPDLRAINEQYRRDGDPLRFMYHALRSPNFQGMVKKSASEPDVQEFLRESVSDPAILGAGRAFLSRYNLKAAVENLGLSLPGAVPPQPAAEGERK